MLAQISDYPWINWVAPAVIIGMCSMAFSVGVYVGQSRSQLDITRLEQVVEAHVESPRHPGALSAETLTVQFAEINRRLNKVEELLERLTGVR